MFYCAVWWSSVVKIHERHVCVLCGDVSFWFVAVQLQNTQKRLFSQLSLISGLHRSSRWPAVGESHLRRNAKICMTPSRLGLGSRKITFLHVDPFLILHVDPFLKELRSEL